MHFLSDDLDAHFRSQYLAQAPSVIQRIQEQKPLTLSGKISIDINSDLPETQTAMLDLLTARPDQHRSNFDKSLLRRFEEAILSGDLDRTHKFVVALYEENREKHWPTRSLFEFLDIVSHDLEPIMSVGFSFSKGQMQFEVTSYFPTRMSPDYKCVAISSQKDQWASAYNGVRLNKTPMVPTDPAETFLEIARQASQRFAESSSTQPR